MQGEFQVELTFWKRLRGTTIGKKWRLAIVMFIGRRALEKVRNILTKTIIIQQIYL
jgi:hypothetical protein